MAANSFTKKYVANKAKSKEISRALKEPSQSTKLTKSNLVSADELFNICCKK